MSGATALQTSKPDAASGSAAGKRSRKTRLVAFVALPVGLLSVAGLGVPAATHGPSGPARVVSAAKVEAQVRGTSLRVMTLNLAHGRSDGFNQVVQGGEQIRKQISAASTVIAREGIDVVALQEADRPSWWSGSFDHVARIAKSAGLGAQAHAANVEGLGLHYGTGVASRYRLADAAGHTFAPSPPTLSKGFTVARVNWPALPGGAVDVVSVHLDFASSAARKSQLDELARLLEQRGRPAIVMGDFNTGWTDDDGALRQFCQRLGLSTFAPTDGSKPTFRTLADRIDWILVSSGLEVGDYRVLDDVVSDHQPVAATITLTKRAPSPAP